MCLQGLEAHEAGNSKAAAELYSGCIAGGGLSKDNLGAAHNNRGSAYLELGLLVRALADHNAAVDLNPRNSLAHNNRGTVYLTLGRHDLSVADHSTAIRLNPGYAKAYANRGRAYSHKSDFTRAIEDYEEVIRLSPNDPRSRAKAHFGRGVNLFYLGRFGDAVTDFKRAAKIDPRVAYWPIWLYLAEAREDGVEEARENLVKRARKTNLEAWPSPVLQYFMGVYSVGEMYGGVGGRTPAMVRQQKCEADFYFGQAMVLANRRSVAGKLLKQAAEKCPLLSVERVAARVERARLAE